MIKHLLVALLALPLIMGTGCTNPGTDPGDTDNTPIDTDTDPVDTGTNATVDPSFTSPLTFSVDYKEECEDVTGCSVPVSLDIHIVSAADANHIYLDKEVDVNDEGSHPVTWGNPDWGPKLEDVTYVGTSGEYNVTVYNDGDTQISASIFSAFPDVVVSGHNFSYNGPEGTVTGSWSDDHSSFSYSGTRTGIENPISDTAKRYN